MTQYQIALPCRSLDLMIVALAYSSDWRSTTVRSRDRKRLERTDGTLMDNSDHSAPESARSPGDGDSWPDAPEQYEYPATRILSDDDVNHSDSLIGARIGNFEIESVLGEGGFGRVYRAQDTELGRTVALKFLTQTVNARYVELFRREAKALGALSKHENVLDIYSWGEYEGHLYIALEYVPFSVGDLLEQNPDGIPLERALEIAEQSARALQFAHDYGIVHRDIKPHNILLDGPDGPVKVADFGLTYFAESPDQTRTRALMGSPPYMSPEQAREEVADHRSDIFSLGATIYEMLCGERAFQADSSLNLLNKVQEASYKSLRERAPHLPPMVHHIVEKALQRDPDQRFATAQELADTVRACRQARSVDTVTPRSSFQKLSNVARDVAVYRRSFLLSTTAVIAMALVLLLTFFWPDRSSVALAQANEQLELERFEAAEALFRKLLNDGGSSDLVLYGLGYALLHQGKQSEAAGEFKRIEDASLKEEGLAAVHRQRGEGMAVGDTGSPTPYTRFLIAASRRENDAALTTFEALEGAAFFYDWQRDEMLQALARALLVAGQPERAAAVLERLNASRVPRRQQFANSLQELANQQLAIQKNKELQQQMERLRMLTNSGSVSTEPPPSEAADTWTSRPITFFFVKSELNNAIIAGPDLALVLPIMLSKRLSESPRFANVDRELLGYTLQEQILQESNGTDDRQFAVGKVLGARLVMRCEFLRFLSEEKLNLRIAETETTERIGVEDVEDIQVSSNSELDNIVDQVANGIVDAVARQFPLQGLIQKSPDDPNGGIRINLGSRLGAKAGDEFSLTRIENGAAIPGVKARIESVDDYYSAVSFVPSGNTAAELMREVGSQEIYAFMRPSNVDAPS